MERALGRSNVKFVPLRVELTRTADWKFTGNGPVRDVPYVPTPENVVAKMLAVAEVSERDVVYDLGCGDGRIVITAAKKCGASGVGIDVDLVRINESKMNAIKSKVSDRVRFEQVSALRADISDATVVALYLLPWMNAALRPKLLGELRPGTRIVAHQFPIADWPADKTVEIPNSDRVVYLWIVPANVKGVWDCTMRTADGVRRRGTLNIEQEFGTIVSELFLDGREFAVESSALLGDRLELRVDGATYVAKVERNTFRGAGKRKGKRGELEIRARRA